MKVTHRVVGLAETATNLALGCALAAVLAADTAVTAAKHHNWAFELAVGAIVAAAALLRGRGRVLAATAALAMCGLAEFSFSGRMTTLAFFSGSPVLALKMVPATVQSCLP